MINVTSATNHQIEKLCQENNCYGITLNLKGGGCAGFEYVWGTTEKEDIGHRDFVVACGEGNLVIGDYSLLYLAGTEIDFVKSLVGSNFEIKNPNAKSSCGCGVSVNFA